MSERHHSHHRSHHRSHRSSHRHREGRRSSSDASAEARKNGGSHARSSRRHQRDAKGRIGPRLLRRLIKNPLIPLVVIVGIIAFALVKSDLEQRPKDEKMQMHPIHKGFSDAQEALQALQLMDAKQFVEAAQAIQGLEMPPIRLSALMESVRADSIAARQTLTTLVCAWILEQDDELKGASFPSKETPTPVLNFIASFEQYRSGPGAVDTPQTNSDKLVALFKRVSLENQLRATEQPMRASPAPRADQTPPAPKAPAPRADQTPPAPKAPAPRAGYAPPVEAP
jgi:hypothetical protein